MCCSAYQRSSSFGVAYVRVHPNPEEVLKEAAVPSGGDREEIARNVDAAAVLTGALTQQVLHVMHFNLMLNNKTQQTRIDLFQLSSTELN
jgi:hypothetical protein